MALKLLVFTVLVATVNAGFLPTIKLNSPEVFLFPPPDNTLIIARAKAAHDGFNNFMKDSNPPRYSFGYYVQVKNGTLLAQYERRNDNVTYGTYSRILLDNSRFAIDYTADFKTLFRITSTPITLTGHINPLEYPAIAGRNSGAITFVAPLAKSTPLKDPLAEAARTIHNAFVRYIKDLAVNHYCVGTEVEDSSTGNVNSHFETMIGDATRGSYTQHKSDGTRRTIDYTDDPRNGFQAVVRDPNASVVSIIYV